MDQLISKETDITLTDASTFVQKKTPHTGRCFENKKEPVFKRRPSHRLFVEVHDFPLANHGQTSEPP